MTDELKMRVFTYSPSDGRVFTYNLWEKTVVEFATMYPDEIFFTLSDLEIEEYYQVDEPPVDNLKHDFIYYKPRISGRCVMQCTCNNFLESDQPTDAGINRLAKKALRHARNTGHTLNPRGN